MAPERAPARREAVRIASVAQPGWELAGDRLPGVGEAVWSVDGAAEVVRILGRTGDGSRLLELRLPDRPKASYFAASSNVLLRPRQSGSPASIPMEF